MSESTRLLLRLIQARVFPAGVFIFLISLLIPLHHPLDAGYLSLMPLIAMVMTLLMRLNSFLGYTMFPVTHRQLAWIPLAVWGALTIAGVAGVLVMHLVSLSFARVTGEGIWHFWMAAVPRWAPVVFALLLLWRFLQLFPAYWAAILPIFFFRPWDEHEGTIPPWLVDAYIGAWPLWVAGCLFVVWEAPYLTAATRRVEYT